MKGRGEVNVRAISITFKDWMQDLELLVKFRLSSFVVFSSAVAYCIAAGSNFHTIPFLILVTGGFLITFSANILNEILEADYDKMMERTSNRPLAAGRWTSSSAVVLAGLTCLVGISLLALLNPLTSFLGMLSLVTYAFLYTPLKRYSTISVIVGAIPGALPVMIGMIAYDGVITPEALFLFAIQFIWQFPHFWAIAWIAHKDYAAAGFKLLPSGDGQTKYSALQAVIYSLLLLPVGIMPYFNGMSGNVSLLIILVANFFMIGQCVRLYREMTIQAARRVMFGSYIYLPVVLLALLIDKVAY